jgi:phosphatidylserine/phosphatidylglycerophosphate/cardiolipin synthase-like enzyme
MRPRRGVHGPAPPSAPRGLALALSGSMLWSVACFAQLPAALPAKGTVQAAFAPWDDAEAVVLDAIRKARRDIRVQAFSFTSRRLAAALMSAQRRGIDVRVIADAEQANGANSRLAELAGAGIAVLLDSRYQSAHSKVMLMDASTADAAVVTGSYNWTYAAQKRNAENLLVLRGNPDLAQAYLANWDRHAAGSRPFLTPP